MSAQATATESEARARPERGLRRFLAEQTPLSLATALVGAFSLSLLLVGTIVLITLHGWIPFESVAAALTSPEQLVIAIVAVAAGAVATGVGYGTYRRMSTKPSREAAVAGAVVGLQSVILGGILLWFRAGDVEIFARNFFQFQLITEAWPFFLRGMRNTVILALGGEALGIAIGLVVAVFALSARAVVRAPARTYINLFRGTPLLWQLSFGYFGIVLGLGLDMSTFAVAMLILGLNAGAYSAEIFRAGIQSIERAQFEAARSVGMTYFQALRYVILPQAIRRVIPPLTNEFVILIKDTSLVAFLGLTFEQYEVFSVGGDLARTHFNATPFIGSAIGYLLVTLPMIRVVNILERRLRSGLTGIAGMGA